MFDNSPDDAEQGAVLGQDLVFRQVGFGRRRRREVAVVAAAAVVAVRAK